MADMLVKLYELPPVHDRLVALEEKGIVIKRPIGPENYAVIDWIRDNFARIWAGESENAFFRSPRSIFVATRGTEILGFACYDATAKGFFGPTGVAKEERGQGIGAALLLSCLHAMRDEGYGYAIIGGVGPADFYSKICGATMIENVGRGIYKDMLRERLEQDGDKLTEEEKAIIESYLGIV